MLSSMLRACPASEPMRQTNSCAPVSIAQMQAVSASVVLPLPRGMAIANSPPRNTAVSILAITFRWSLDHGRLKVSGKYASQKNRKSVAALALRCESTTSGISPMSRPMADSSALRARAASFIAS